MIWIWDLLLIAVTVSLDRRISGRRYSPLSVFAVSWLGPLALRHLDLVDYEPLNLAAGLMIYGGFLCFALGYTLVLAAAVKSGGPCEESSLVGRLDPRVLTVVTMIVTIAGAAVTAYQVVSVIAAYGLIGFILNPLEVREDFMLSGWGAVYQINLLLPSLLVLRHRSLGGRPDRWTVLMGIVVVVALLLADQKQALVKAFVMAAVVATLFETSVKLRTLASIALVLLLFFVGYARITSPYYEGDHRFYVRDGHIHLPQVLAPLGNPYHYLTSGYGNLQIYVDDLDEHLGGKDSTRPFRYIWQRLQGSRDIESHHGRFYYGPLFGNTHTYLRQFFADGGVPAALLLSAVLGLFCAWIYVEIVWGGNVWLAPLYGVIGWCLFISFFSNHWVYFGTWLLFALALLVGGGSQVVLLARSRHAGPA